MQSKKQGKKKYSLRPPKYFKGRISKGFISLYSSRTIFKVGSNLLGLFLPIFLYEIFNFEFKFVLYYYLIKSILYLFSIGLGARFLNKIGLRRSLRISTLWILLFYVFFFILDKTARDSGSLFSDNPNLVFLLLGISLIFITLRSIMFWVPFHTDMAKFTNKTNRAKQISLFSMTETVIQAGAPIVAGLILSIYNYDILFLIVIFITLASSIPLSTLPRTKERFSWTYSQTWKEFISKERRGAILAYMGDGAERTIGVIIWPIFMWKILEGNYFQVGLISSAVIIFTVLLQFSVGKKMDLKTGDKRKMLKYGTFLYAIGWIIKIFVATAFHIFAASIYHSITKIFTQTPFNALTYEKAADQGHFVDEYTVIHEMAAHSGKIITLLLALILILFFSIEYTFIIAATATFLLNFITIKKFPKYSSRQKRASV